jgi:hypothetical protein
MDLEVLSKVAERLVPERAERIEPRFGGFEGSSREAEVVHAPFDRSRDESGPFEDPEMFRDRGEAHPEWAREVGHLRGSERELGEQPTTRRVRECVEQTVE